ncbi:hypothetical protein H5410_040540 [Solanum commersonii]|uniref:Uncharacterized protein n=1 Tax=Solanum commersonii TaxID=4109 RepID=A0A9J5XQF4_SOLCO|nr:hypothetical protein H5410_040540 [Solanum commersonii]
MAPKGKNVASGSGTKKSRKGVAVGSSSRETTNLPPQKFGKQALMHYGEDWYKCQQQSKYLGECNLSLVREFYANWSTHRVELNQGLIRDSRMGRLFGMAELQLRIGGRLMIEDEMATLAEHYPLTDSVMYLFRMGPAFQEPIDDDDAIADAEDGSDEEASDDTGPGDGDTDASDGDGVAASI